MRIDPFFVKRLSKAHPKRLLYTLWCRWSDYRAGLFFDEYSLPIVEFAGTPSPPTDTEWSDTQVEPHQVSHLLHGLALAKGVSGCVVEIGSWRGVTTRILADATKDIVFAIDPFIGAGNEQNLVVFRERMASAANVTLLRLTSGEAARNWAQGPIRFLFIDAAHDYANVTHDLFAWRPHLCTGAVVAIHDTDREAFAGCRRAVFEALDRYRLIAHIPNLSIIVPL